jgi:hypothetical protein
MARGSVTGAARGLYASGYDDRMRRLLIGLALALLLVVSIGVGVAVARWPYWRV